MGTLQTDFFNHYLYPVTRMMQHQWLTYILQLRACYMDIHSGTVQWFLEQQARYAGHDALVAYQLSCWKQLEAQLEPIETLLFCIALIPFKLIYCIDNIEQRAGCDNDEEEYSHQDIIPLIEICKTVSMQLLESLRKSDVSLTVIMNPMIGLLWSVNSRLQLMFNRQNTCHPRGSSSNAIVIIHPTICASWKHELYLLFHQCFVAMGKFMDLINMIVSPDRHSYNCDDTSSTRL